MLRGNKKNSRRGRHDNKKMICDKKGKPTNGQKLSKIKIITGIAQALVVAVMEGAVVAAVGVVEKVTVVAAGVAVEKAVVVVVRVGGAVAAVSKILLTLRWVHAVKSLHA